MQPKAFSYIKNELNKRFKFEAVRTGESYGVNRDQVNRLNEPVIAIYEVATDKLNDTGKFIKEMPYDEFMGLKSELSINDNHSLGHNKTVVIQNALDCQICYSFL